MSRRKPKVHFSTVTQDAFTAVLMQRLVQFRTDHGLSTPILDIYRAWLDGLQSGAYVRRSPVLLDTCKALGIECTREAINHIFNTQTQTTETKD